MKIKLRKDRDHARAVGGKNEAKLLLNYKLLID